MVDIILLAIDYVKQEMKDNDSSHDYYHIERVHKLAKFIATNEGVDNENMQIIQLAAIFHDIKDWKYSGSETASTEATRKFLLSNNTSAEIIDNVCFIIENISFSKELNNKMIEMNHDLRFKLLAIVQDADRLDALGAIGIARCLIYGSRKNQVLYDPSIKPRYNITKDEYTKNKTTTINHFYEKLFKLPSMMKTNTGRIIAEKRMKIMYLYLDLFKAEWLGDDYSLLDIAIKLYNNELFGLLAC